MDSGRSHYRTRFKHDLTPQQERVLTLIARGRTNAEIADELGITLDGIKYHVREILGKLGVDSREEAAEWWQQYAGRSSRLRRSLQAGLALSPLKLAAGGAALAAVVVVTAAAGYLLSGGSDSSEAAEHPLDILRRSDRAMAAVSAFRVEGTLRATAVGQDPWGGLFGSTYRGRHVATTAIDDDGNFECQESTLGWQPYTRRSEGAKSLEDVVPGSSGGPATDIRLLATERYAGHDVWIVAYHIEADGLPGSISIAADYVEWIRESDFLLLRQEQLQKSSQDIDSRMVQVFLYDEKALAIGCPAPLTSDPSLFEPRRLPRQAQSPLTPGP